MTRKKFWLIFLILWVFRDRVLLMFIEWFRLEGTLKSYFSLSRLSTRWAYFLACNSLGITVALKYIRWAPHEPTTLHVTDFLSSAVLSLSCPSIWSYKAKTLSQNLFSGNSSPIDILHFNLLCKSWFVFLLSSKKNKICCMCHVSSNKSLPSSSNFHLPFSPFYQIPLNKYSGQLIASSPSVLMEHYPSCFTFLFSQYLKKTLNGSIWKQ